MKKLLSVLSVLLICSMLLTACGGGGQQSSTGGSTAGGQSAGAESPASGGQAEPAGEGDYTFRTSADNKVVTENGTFTKDNVVTPILITSFGQSADVSMLDALMKKTGAEYTFNATASADDAASFGTVIIACGASSKGLGAAGISQEDEIARAEAIQAALGDDTIVIVAHLGGASRRGALSDQFNDMALSIGDYVIVVEEGNDDGKFTDAATDKGIPITLLNSISDAVTPLTELFGA